MGGVRPSSVQAPGAMVAGDGAAEPATWCVAEETPIGILMNSEPVAVMMATPADLEEMAIGFLVAEGHARADQIRAALVLPTEDGLCVDVATADSRPTPRPARRSLEGRSGCGLCGMNALTDVRREVPRIARAPLDARAVARAFAGLSGLQPIRRENRSVHAAGLALADGTVVLAREDVGRHPALDKAVGALVVEGIDPATVFAVMTSRCSFELVQKAAIAGLAGLATLSAPTALALSVAKDAGLPVAARAGDGIMLF